MRRAVALLTLAALLAGCAATEEAGTGLEGEVASTPGGEAREFTFERLIHTTAVQAWAYAQRPVTESCLRVDLPAGWVLASGNASADWESQPPMAEELELVVYDAETYDDYARVLGTGHIDAAFGRDGDARAVAAGTVLPLRNPLEEPAPRMVVEQAVLVRLVLQLEVPAGEDPGSAPQMVDCAASRLA